MIRNPDAEAAAFVIAFGVVVGWFCWIYTAYGTDVLQMHLTAAALAAAVSVTLVLAAHR